MVQLKKKKFQNFCRSLIFIWDEEYVTFELDAIWVEMKCMAFNLTGTVIDKRSMEPTRVSIRIAPARKTGLPF